MNSPSQKDSGIDDSSPLSYDEPVDQSQIPVYPPIAKKESRVTDKVFVVDSSISERKLLKSEVENHNSVLAADCETCVDNSVVGETGHNNQCKVSDGNTDSHGSESIIIIDDEDDLNGKAIVNTRVVDWNAEWCEVSQSKQKCTGSSADLSACQTSAEEVVISSTTSPERDGLLKDAGLLTDSIVSNCGPRKKGANLKTEGIFEIFSVNNVDSTDDLIQIRHGTGASERTQKTPEGKGTEEDVCDSTQHLCVSDRPALFSIFNLGTDSLADTQHRNSSKECSENKSHSENLRRNIFEVLAQQTSLHMPEKAEILDCEEKSTCSWPNEKEFTKNKLPVSSSRNKGTDFESATGESQFNFYNSNEVIKDSCMDSSGVIYNDCYMADEGDLQSLQNTCSSLQSDDNDCYSHGGHTPSKYAFFPQDSSHVKDMLSLNEMSVGEESPKRESGTDFQCEFTKYLQTKTSLKASPATQESDESSPVKVTDKCHSGLKQNSRGWTMSSRQIKCFQSSHQRLVLLRRKVCKFLRLVFPFIQYPAYFKTHAICVENLLDQLICITDNSKARCHTQHAIPNEQSCCEVRVVICKSPRQCLNYLRRKIVRFLQAVLPDMKMSPSFDTSSEMVETLLQQIIICNQNLDKSS